MDIYRGGKYRMRHTKHTFTRNVLNLCSNARSTWLLMLPASRSPALVHPPWPEHFMWVLRIRYSYLSLTFIIVGICRNLFQVMKLGERC